MNATQRNAPLAPDQTRPDQTRPRSAITHHMHRLCEQDAAFRKSIGGMIWPRGASIARLREGAEPVTSDSLLVQTKESDHTFDSTTCGVWCGGDAYLLIHAHATYAMRMYVSGFVAAAAYWNFDNATDSASPEFVEGIDKLNDALQVRRHPPPAAAAAAALRCCLLRAAIGQMVRWCGGRGWATERTAAAAALSCACVCVVCLFSGA